MTGTLRTPDCEAHGTVRSSYVCTVRSYSTFVHHHNVHGSVKPYPHHRTIKRAEWAILSIGPALIALAAILHTSWYHRIH